MARPLQGPCRHHRGQAESHHHQHGPTLHHAVAAAEQDPQRHQAGDDTPGSDTHLWKEQVEALSHPADDSPNQAGGDQGADEPAPDHPGSSPARTRNPVHRPQRGVSRGDGVASDLHLQDHLGSAAQKDQPQRRKSQPGSQRGGNDQLARAHDPGGQDERGSDLAKPSQEVPGRGKEPGRTSVDGSAGWRHLLRSPSMLLGGYLFPACRSEGRPRQLSLVGAERSGTVAMLSARRPTAIPQSASISRAKIQSGAAASP